MTIGQKIITDKRRGANDFMLISFCLKSIVSEPAVCSNVGARLHHLFKRLFNGGGRGIGNNAQADATNASAIFLSCDQNQGLSLGSASTFSGSFAANHGFIHLDGPGKSISSRANHGPAKFVQPCPCGLIAAKSQNSLNAKGADAIFLTGDIPDSTEPQRQRKPRTLKNGSGSHGRLIPTLATKDKPCLHSPTFAPAATGAQKTRGPAQRLQVSSTCFVAGKAFFHINQVARVIFHAGILYIVVG